VAAGCAPSRAAWPAARQDDELLSDLYQGHALALLRMANLLLRDKASAEDVVQDAFLNLHRALGAGCRAPAAAPGA
jgi:DNA-directed RNA polymerase specialized sigma24 family protein